MNSLILSVLILLAAAVLAPLVIHRVYRAPRVPERRTPADLGLPYETVRIPTENGKLLFAWLVPSGAGIEKAPAVAVMHGWGGNAEHMLPFAALFHRAGWAVLLLSSRNHGSSDADSFSSLPRFAEDLEHGFDWLGNQPGIDPQRRALLGHSVGAAAALLVASRRHEPVAVISVAAFAHPVELMRRQMRSYHIPYFPLGWLVLRFIERTIKADFDDIAPCNSIRQATCPVLLVHGEEDERVPSADALRIHANSRKGRCGLLMLPNTRHDSTNAISTYGASLVAFLQQSVVGASGPGKSGRGMK